MSDLHASPGHGKRAEVTLALRAKRAARDESQSTRRYPKRFIFFGPRMVTLEEHLLSHARTHHSMQKRINVLLHTISRYKAVVARRELTLGKAHRYIQYLKANGATHPRNSPPPNLISETKAQQETSSANSAATDLKAGNSA